MKLRHILRSIMQPAAVALLMATALLAACGNDNVDSKYSNYRASFSLSPINTISPLTAALNSYGEFCTISATTSQYIFRSLTNSEQVNRDAYTAYRTFICIAGFIVGRTSMTELGTGNYPVVCYDLACPNCYSSDGISRALSLQSGAKAKCTRCSRVYDLNNEGIITDGENGKHLERYHISYSSTTIMISN